MHKFLFGQRITNTGDVNETYELNVSVHMSAFNSNILFHCCCWFGLVFLVLSWENRCCCYCLCCSWGRNECHQWSNENLLVVFGVQGPYDPDQTMRMHCVMTEKYALQHFKISAAAAVAPPLTFSSIICRKYNANKTPKKQNCENRNIWLWCFYFVLSCSEFVFVWLVDSL